jgi:hypothetical protein
MRGATVEHLLHELSRGDRLGLALELEVLLPARDVVDEQQSPERRGGVDLSGERAAVERMSSRTR